MSDEEEAEMRAYWDANIIRRAEKKAVEDADELVELQKRNNLRDKLDLTDEEMDILWNN
jgi:hypothetical protein